MDKLRVIAVERTSIDYIGEQEVFACIYKDNTLFLYGPEEQGKLIADYFSGFDMLEYFVDVGKYEWTDFTIDSGLKISRDQKGNILVNNKAIGEPLKQLEEKAFKQSDSLIVLYYEFLKTYYKNDYRLLEELEKSLENGELKKEITEIVNQNVGNDLSWFDKLLIIRIRLEGIEYLINCVRSKLKNNWVGKYDEINFMFSRVFKLEKINYINLSFAMDNE